MSDSENGGRSSADLERALRDAVIAIHKTGKSEELTVKRVRTRAEESLGLSAGFFRADPEWKDRSQNFIQEAFDKYCGDDSESEPEPTPQRKKAAKPKPAPKKSKPASEPSRGAKRKSTTDKKPKKRRKTSISSDEESDAAEPAVQAKSDSDSDVEREGPRKPARRARKVVDDTDEEHEDDKKSEIVADKEVEDEATAPSKPQVSGSAADTKDDASDSEMSVLIDESPVKKKRQKKAVTEKPSKRSKTKPAKSTAKTSKPKATQDLDPQAAEIKNLQGWLVKCGIRKVWGKELMKYDTPKEKINHLKEMLKDAGMEGRFSEEKAAKIKELREIRADLEATQEFNKHWGEKSEDTGRPQRRVARGLQNLNLIHDDDDEDSDEGVKRKDDDKTDGDHEEEEEEEEESEHECQYDEDSD